MLYRLIEFLFFRICEILVITLALYLILVVAYQKGPGDSLYSITSFRGIYQALIGLYIGIGYIATAAASYFLFVTFGATKPTHIALANTTPVVIYGILLMVLLWEERVEIALLTAIIALANFLLPLVLSKSRFSPESSNA